ncbi:MAG: hypothetical protein IKC48_02490 [Clostridia bacterium]|nr:hypothetical protein [Clostridia bacterium]
MVTVKRKINSETERYGGFSEIEVKAPATKEYDVRGSFSHSEQIRAERNVEYSMPTVTTVDDSITVDSNIPVVSEENEQSISQYMLDIRSAKPQRMEQEVPETNEKRALDKRTKLILGIYLAIIVLLSSLVIGTGVYLTSHNASVNDLQGELAIKNVVLSEQAAEIASLSDVDAILGRAYASGMEAIEDAEVIKLLPVEDVAQMEGTTNWFDALCDWFNR